MTDKISRRTLGGLAAAGAGLPLLAACGGNDSQGAAVDQSGTTPGGTSSSTRGSSGGSGGGGGGGGGGEPLTKSSDIEVGGGQIFPDQQVVVTQPNSGQFKCFTAVCSHQGCIVSDVSGGTINCNCHGSRFSITDGSVITGPATFPLSAEQITVSGSEISLA